MCNFEQRHSTLDGKLNELVAVCRCSGFAQSYLFSRKYYSALAEVVALMETVKADPQKPIIRNWKPQDWIDHASFGVGQVSESRGDKLDIDFVNGGRKTLLKSTELNRADAPGAGLEFPRVKSKPRSGQMKVKSPPKQALKERKTVSHA
jgi:hypothetical protein